MGVGSKSSSTMSQSDIQDQTTETQLETELEAELSAGLSADKPKAAPRGAPKKRSASRQPGRPHKRLQGDVLQTRTEQLRKKLEVLVAKRILIAERLEAYEQEVQLRATTEEPKA
jgi:transposase-like protein